MTATVKLSKSATFELIMTGLEAYAVQHDSQYTLAIETGAHLWGSINKRGPFKCNIEHLSTDTSARRTQDSLNFHPQSLTIKKEIASIFGKGYEYIGTAHTHPYLKESGLNAALIRSEKLYELSSPDHICEINNPQIELGNKKYSVALVLTIFAMKRANDQKDGLTFTDNLKEFSLGNIKCWLYAQVFVHKAVEKLNPAEIKEFEVYGLDFSEHEGEGNLPIPVTTVLQTEVETETLYQAFGRLKISDDNSLYIPKESAEKRWFAEID